MPIVQLSTVAYSVIIARILYALPAWGGFITSEHKHSINAFLNALNPITACTVVQAVVKATSQSNGKGQILTPRAPKPLNGFR